MSFEQYVQDFVPGGDIMSHPRKIYLVCEYTGEVVREAIVEAHMVQHMQAKLCEPNREWRYSLYTFQDCPHMYMHQTGGHPQDCPECTHKEQGCLYPNPCPCCSLDGTHETYHKVLGPDPECPLCCPTCGESMGEDGTQPCSCCELDDIPF